MASDHDDDPSSRLHSDSSADDSSSQDSDSMPRTTDATGVRRKSTSGSSKKGSNDPHREKRKKAKRACRPCQVAHLTCGKTFPISVLLAPYPSQTSCLIEIPGDERPCGRCVKRGCAHMCKDGVRKKAKYLADTPAEALTQELGARGRPPVSNSQNFLSRQPFGDMPGGVPRTIYHGPSNPYGPYGSTGQSAQSLDPLNPPQSFGNQPGVLPPNYNLGNGPQSLPLQSYNSTMPQGGQDPMQNDYGGDIFAPFDSNFLDNLNFENRFAAAEFGMLGNMTAGMASSPPSDGTGPFQAGAGAFTPNTTSSSFAQSPVDLQSASYPPNQGIAQWSKDGHSKVKFEPAPSRSGGRSHDPSERMIKQEAPPALAIGSSAYPSPISGSSPQGTMGGIEDSITARNTYTNINPQRQSPAPLDQASRRQQRPTSATSTSMNMSTFTDQAALSRRHRNPSEVYSNVTQPYSYTVAFHSLTALIQNRFSPQKTAHIAKALAAIRPSFISCTMRLNRDDLIFMEKCLQRTLWGLEDMISTTSVPTIICRRTGEVVGVGKEFSMITGWSRDILLGRAPNLNANTGGDNSGLSGTASSSRGGQSTPRLPDQRPDAPVNIVSIFDDESACDFFDDYAHLAFGDSRGTVTTPCKLLKYKTAEEMNNGRLDDIGTRIDQQQIDARSGVGAGVSRSESDKGKVSCMLCWTVKRDVFDIPMLFVMNVSNQKKAHTP